MKLIYCDILKLKNKNRKYKSILIVFPIACFEELFFFLLKAPLDPSPSGYKSF